MRTISHNTFSYLPVANFWMRPFAFIAKCQSMSIDEQMDIVSGIELRVRFVDNKPVLAHGLIRYKGANIKGILYAINKCVTEPFYVRVLLGTTPFMSEEERAEQKTLFRNFCEELSNTYCNLTFWGGWARDEWRNKIFDFKTREPRVTEMHGSVSGNKLNCLRLKAYAQRNNAKIIESTNTEYVMLDFIEYGKK